MSIRTPWLTEAAGVKVERLTRAPSGRAIARSHAPASLAVPRKGVMHTTEGSFEGSAEVFTRTGTPTFMGGRDRSNRLRCAQFMPIGEMSLTLVNESGGTETNREAHVQIELVSFSRREFGWPLGVDKRPMDEDVKALLADLVQQASKAAEIPLRHAGNGTRSLTRWDREPGWFGHSEVPENVHWDPGNFDWADLFKRAGASAPGEEDDLPLTREDFEQIEAIVRKAAGPTAGDFWDHVFTYGGSQAPASTFLGRAWLNAQRANEGVAALASGVNLKVDVELLADAIAANLEQRDQERLLDALAERLRG